MQDRITSITQSPSTSILLHAPPGRGKTTFVGSFTKGKTLIVRPPTDNVDPLIGVPNASKIDQLIVDCWNDMEEVFEFVRHHPKDYSWIWLDSISLLQEHLLDDVFADAVARKPDRAKGPIDKGEYGLNMTRIKKWTRGMISTPGFGFGMTAHSTELTDELGEEVKRRPWIQGRMMSPTVSGYFNIVGYLDLHKGQRSLRTAETEEFFAKDQLSLFPGGKLVDPTMDKVAAAISKKRGSMGRATATKSTARRRSTVKRG